MAKDRAWSSSASANFPCATGSDLGGNCEYYSYIRRSALNQIKHALVMSQFDSFFPERLSSSSEHLPVKIRLLQARNVKTGYT